MIEARKQILEQVYALRRMRKEELTKGEPDSSAKEDYEKKIGELAKGMVQVERWLLLKEIEALQQQLVAKRLQLEQERSKSEESIDRSPRNGWIRLHEELSFSFKAVPNPYPLSSELGEEEESESLPEIAQRGMPPWLISLVIHLVIILVLVLIPLQSRL